MKENRNNRRASRPGAISGVILTAALALLLTACGAKSGAPAAPAGSKITEGQALTINTGDLSDTPKFYPVEVDGTQMEVIAVKAPDGTVRTAFNTCQVCYSSGRGYYKQSGDKLVCQNCGNRFSMDQVEVQAGGCNPWPIFEESKTTTDGNISISYDFLKESESIFANWK